MFSVLSQVLGLASGWMSIGRQGCHGVQVLVTSLHCRFLNICGLMHSFAAAQVRLLCSAWRCVPDGGGDAAPDGGD